jgi:nucleotide-binding universal stress UspA family protein
MSKTILVPVDGSEHSKKALEFAAELGTKFEGQLSLFHVLQSLPLDRTLILGAAAITVHTTGDELEDVGVKVIAAAREIAAAHGCTDVEAKAVLGDPASEIVERAREIDADMIVMGSRGLSDLTGLLMGSVSHKVAHLAPCTCVTVR